MSSAAKKVKGPENEGVGHVDQDDWFEDRETLGSLGGHGGGGHDDGESIWLLSYADMMTLLFGFFVLITSFSKLDLEEFEKARREATKLFGGEYTKTNLQLQKDLEKSLKSPGSVDTVLFDETDKGVNITFRGSLFFDSGSSELREDAREMLTSVIPNIKKQTYRYNILVEGHTDDNPITTDKFPSNWELSSQRAAAVLCVFESEGFDRSQLRAVGYADTSPILPNRDPEGKPIAENQNQNRRVVIKLIRTNQPNP